MEKFPSPFSCRYGTEKALSCPSWWGAPELPLCNGLPCKDAICRGHRASRMPHGLGSGLGGLWAGSRAGAGRALSTASRKMGACKGQVERQREKDRGLELPRQRDSWSCHGYLGPSLKTCCWWCPSPFPSAQEDGVWALAHCKLKVPLFLAISTRCSQHPNGLAVSRPSPESTRPEPRRLLSALPAWGISAPCSARHRMAEAAECRRRRAGQQELRCSHGQTLPWMQLPQQAQAALEQNTGWGLPGSPRCTSETTTTAREGWPEPWLSSHLIEAFCTLSQLGSACSTLLCWRAESLGDRAIRAEPAFTDRDKVNPHYLLLGLASRGSSSRRGLDLIISTSLASEESPKLGSSEPMPSVTSNKVGCSLPRRFAVPAVQFTEA